MGSPVVKKVSFVIIPIGHQDTSECQTSTNALKKKLIRLPLNALYHQERSPVGENEKDLWNSYAEGIADKPG